MKEFFSHIKVRHIIWAGTAATVLLIIFSIFISEVKSGYAQMIQDFRDQKDEFFRESERSPVEDKKNFKGLEYFPPSEHYKVNAALILLNDTSAILTMKNDGRTDKYFRYARVNFSLEGKEHQLTLLKKENSDPEDKVLFLPFSDKTNGDESYQGGRYMDIALNENTTEIILDFNLAYNPFCVYSYRYSCPLPPAENALDAEIRAGEKIWDRGEN